MENKTALIAQAKRAGSFDGSTAELLREPADPRLAWNNHPELPESVWEYFCVAYTQAYQASANQRRR